MIVLLPYDPKWKGLFEEEKLNIQASLGDIVANIEHIGSTAIPGIHAKPVIDILIGVNDLDSFTEEHIKKLNVLGYYYQPLFENEFPNRRYFFKNNESGNRTHQIHLVNYPSSWWIRHILFRDYMRAYPKAALDYEKHKFVLANELEDTLSYAKAKTNFCEGIFQRAFFDFNIHRPAVITDRLYGYIPQIACFEVYKAMFQDPDFVRCFGIKLNDEKIESILKRDSTYWDAFRFGPYVWFEKETHEFVGEGGLNHTFVEGKPEIELTYSLSKKYWGKGFAFEIGRQAIKEAFTMLGLDHLVCFTMPSNTQSLRVMEKLGFAYVKEFTHADLPHVLMRLSNIN